MTLGSDLMRMAQLNDEIRQLKAERDALQAALHEIAEEWAGAECGEPVTAQEAYAIELARRMGWMAAKARDAAMKETKV